MIQNRAACCAQLKMKIVNTSLLFLIILLSRPILGVDDDDDDVGERDWESSRREVDVEPDDVEGSDALNNRKSLTEYANNVDWESAKNLSRDDDEYSKADDVQRAAEMYTVTSENNNASTKSNTDANSAEIVSENHYIEDKEGDSIHTSEDKYDFVPLEVDLTNNYEGDPEVLPIENKTKTEQIPTSDENDTHISKSNNITEEITTDDHWRSKETEDVNSSINLKYPPNGSVENTEENTTIENNESMENSNVFSETEIIKYDAPKSSDIDFHTLTISNSTLNNSSPSLPLTKDISTPATPVLGVEDISEDNEQSNKQDIPEVTTTIQTISSNNFRGILNTTTLDNSNSMDNNISYRTDSASITTGNSLHTTNSSVEYYEFNTSGENSDVLLEAEIIEDDSSHERSDSSAHVTIYTTLLPSTKEVSTTAAPEDLSTGNKNADEQLLVSNDSHIETLAKNGNNVTVVQSTKSPSNNFADVKENNRTEVSVNASENLRIADNTSNITDATIYDYGLPQSSVLEAELIVASNPSEVENLNNTSPNKNFADVKENSRNENFENAFNNLRPGISEKEFLETVIKNNNTLNSSNSGIDTLIQANSTLPAEDSEHVQPEFVLTNKSDSILNILFVVNQNDRQQMVTKNDSNSQVLGDSNNVSKEVINQLASLNSSSNNNRHILGNITQESSQSLDSNFKNDTNVLVQFNTTLYNVSVAKQNNDTQTSQKAFEPLGSGENATNPYNNDLNVIISNGTGFLTPLNDREQKTINIVNRSGIPEDKDDANNSILTQSQQNYTSDNVGSFSETVNKGIIVPGLETLNKSATILDMMKNNSTQVPQTRIEVDNKKSSEGHQNNVAIENIISMPVSTTYHENSSLDTTVTESNTSNNLQNNSANLLKINNEKEINNSIIVEPQRVSDASAPKPDKTNAYDEHLNNALVEKSSTNDTLKVITDDGNNIWTSNNTDEKNNSILFYSESLLKESLNSIEDTFHNATADQNIALVNNNISGIRFAENGISNNIFNASNTKTDSDTVKITNGSSVLHIPAPETANITFTSEDLGVSNNSVTVAGTKGNSSNGWNNVHDPAHRKNPSNSLDSAQNETFATNTSAKGLTTLPTLSTNFITHILPLISSNTTLESEIVQSNTTVSKNFTGIINNTSLLDSNNNLNSNRSSFEIISLTIDIPPLAGQNLSSNGTIEVDETWNILKVEKYSNGTINKSDYLKYKDAADFNEEDEIDNEEEVNQVMQFLELFDNHILSNMFWV